MKIKTYHLVLALICIVFTTQVRAQSVLYVTSLGDNGPGTLRQQVINAFPGDTIKFQVTGTIFLSTGRINFSKNLVIEGPGMNNLIITPSSPDRILTFVGNVRISKLTIKDGFTSSSGTTAGISGYGGIVKIDEVKFDNCRIQNSSAAAYGGALSVSGDSVSIQNCIFLNNRATSALNNAGGGAVTCGALKLIIKNCTFQGNVASANCNPSNGDLYAYGYGGALRIYGVNDDSDILVDSCTFISNSIVSTCTYNAGGVTGNAYAYGGAINLDQIVHANSIKIRNSTFTSNIANASGASIYDYSRGSAIGKYSTAYSATTSTIEMENLMINNNNSIGAGEGAVYIRAGGVKMSHCEIINNSAVNGAVDILGSRPVDIRYCNFSDNNGIGLRSKVYNHPQNFSNCLFKGNDNSAIYLNDVESFTNITNSTFTENSSTGGSSIYLTTNSGQINIMNCTMMNETVVGAGKPHAMYVHNSSNVYMKNNILSIPTFSSNPMFTQVGSTILTGGGNIVRDASIATFLVSPTDMNNTNPMLDAFGNHGGPTFSYSLLPGSPAINLGGADTLSIDQRGFYRDANIDAGAFEFGAANPNMPIVLSSSSNTSICANSFGQIWVTSNTLSQDPVQYQWKLNGVDIFGATNSTYLVSSSTPGIYTYTCELYNGAGTDESDPILVEVFATPLIIANTDASICAGENATVSASGAATYSWNHGLGTGASHSVSPTSTTTYTVTGTDANGCENTDDVTITVHNLPTVSTNANASICVGESVTISASGATSYSWNNGLGAGASQTVSPTSTTTYTVTGTDANGCENTDDVTITVHNLPTVSTNANTSICVGESVTISASGTTSYSWNNGLGAGASHLVSPTSTTTYTVTGIDANGCENMDDVTITVHNLPMVTASADETICGGEDAIISASGAITYTWSNSLGAGASHSVSPTVTTTYTVTGTDGNGCENTDQVGITVNQAPNLMTSNDVSICVGGNTIISASGAVSYFWNNGLGAGNSHNVSPVSTTTYIVEGVGSNGCTATETVMVTVNMIPVVIASADDIICEGENITISASGATSYSWNNGAGLSASVSVSPATTTTYTVTGTSNNCSSTDQVTITVNPTPSVDAGSPITVCPGNSATISASGAVAYSWDNGLGNGSTHTVSPTSTTTYTVTGTGANGCTSMDAVTVSIGIIPDNGVLVGTDQITITANSVGADYIWVDCDNNFEVIPGETNQSFTVTANGSYAVIVSNQGCTDTSQCILIDHLSLENLQKNQIISVYPNPFNSDFTVSFTNAGVHIVELIDVLGKQIRLIEMQEQNTIISTTDLCSGTYYLRVIDENLVFKLVKN